jgi:hypothetical protein
MGMDELNPGPEAHITDGATARSLVEEAARTTNEQRRKQLLREALDLEVEGDAQYEAFEAERTHLLDRIHAKSIVTLNATEFDNVEDDVDSLSLTDISRTKMNAKAAQSEAPSVARVPHVFDAQPRKSADASNMRNQVAMSVVDSAVNIAVKQPSTLTVKVHNNAEKQAEPLTPKPQANHDKRLLSPVSSIGSGSSSRKRPRKLEVRSLKASPANSSPSRRKPKKLEIRSGG